MRTSPLRKQRGVALLVVLILLVMMTALAAKISQQFCRNLQKTRYQIDQQQLRWAMQSQDEVVKERLQKYAGSDNKGLSPEGEWHEPLETRGENYTVVSQIEDAQTCFNVNSLLAIDNAPPTADPAAPPSKPLKEQIVEQLLVDSGVSTVAAEEVYQQLVDDLDSDDITAKDAPERDAWIGTVPAQLPANQMMRTISEIKRLPAFPPAAYRNVSKVLCALPDTGGQVDVNTLSPQQAPLLSALFIGTLSADDAARLIASRPQNGWESLDAFSKELETNYPQSKAMLAQVQPFLAVNSHFFRLNSTGNSDDLTLRVVSQLHVDNEAGGVTTWQRRYRIME